MTIRRPARDAATRTRIRQEAVSLAAQGRRWIAAANNPLSGAFDVPGIEERGRGLLAAAAGLALLAGR